MTADAVERVRMALAEAGYPDAEVRSDTDGGAAVMLSGEHAVPDEVCWRAHVVAQSVPDVPCWTCWTLDSSEVCLALGEGVEDCGVDRNVAVAS